MTDVSIPCPSCGHPLEPDGECLACAFSGALAADSSDPDGTTSSFGKFAPLEPGGFGRYALKTKRGEGGMGVVWEAEDSQLRRMVALKAIRGFAFASETEKKRFRSEAAAVAQLDHPHIVPVYDVAEYDGQPFFTMKLLTGGSLSDRLANGPLSSREAALLMEKVARAIHHAHERGVLHRDLKPDNILFDDQGEPYLSDFGLAKLVDSNVHLTRASAHLGTPHYMSPEQARGTPDKICTASDVWGAGAMLYHMLTGRHPFPGTSPGEIFDRVANEDPVPMDYCLKKKDRPLETLCLRCLAKNPEDRLASAKVFADELRRWLANEPIHTRRIAPGGSALRWAGKFPRRIGAGIALASALVAVGFLAKNPKEPSPQTNSAEPTPPNLTADSHGIDVEHKIEISHLLFDATNSTEAAGLWIVPGDTIQTRVEGSYTFRNDPRIILATGEPNTEPPATGEDFAFPDHKPWAVVGVVRPDEDESEAVTFDVTDKLKYPGQTAGGLWFAINTPNGQPASAGGFSVHAIVSRSGKITAQGTDPSTAWGEPLLRIEEHDRAFSTYVSGQARYSADSPFSPAGRPSPGSREGLLVPHMDRHAIVAKIGGGRPFGLAAGFRSYRGNQKGWLRVSVNDEIAQPGSYADNSGSLQITAFVDRAERVLNHPIADFNSFLRPLSLGDVPDAIPRLCALTKDLDSLANGARDIQALILSNPPPDYTSVGISVIKIAPDTYSFKAEGLPSPPGIDSSRFSPYLLVNDAERLRIQWTRDFHDRAMFHLRRPLHKGSGELTAHSFEAQFRGNRFLCVEPDGRLRINSSNGTEAFERSATWILGLDEKSGEQR